MRSFDHIPASTVRFWAWLDSSVTWSLALPFMAPKFIGVIYWINGLLGGTSVAPVFEPIHIVFVCLTGSLVSIWVIARLLHPAGILAAIDGWGRLFVSALLIYIMLVMDGPRALWLFVFTEGIGAVAQLRAAYWPEASTVTA